MFVESTLCLTSVVLVLLVTSSWGPGQLIFQHAGNKKSSASVRDTDGLRCLLRQKRLQRDSHVIM